MALPGRICWRRMWIFNVVARLLRTSVWWQLAQGSVLNALSPSRSQQTMTTRDVDIMILLRLEFSRFLYIWAGLFTRWKREARDKEEGGRVKRLQSVRGTEREREKKTQRRKKVSNKDTIKKTSTPSHAAVMLRAPKWLAVRGLFSQASHAAVMLRAPKWLAVRGLFSQAVRRIKWQCKCGTGKPSKQRRRLPDAQPTPTLSEEQTKGWAKQMHPHMCREKLCHSLGL